jgi:hypothetical protein
MLRSADDVVSFGIQSCILAIHDGCVASWWFGKACDSGPIALRRSDECQHLDHSSGSFWRVTIKWLQMIAAPQSRQGHPCRRALKLRQAHLPTSLKGRHWRVRSRLFFGEAAGRLEGAPCTW